MNHLSVETKLDSFFKPALLRSKQVQINFFYIILNKGSTVIFLLFIFISTIYIIKFSIYLCSKFFLSFRATFAN
jgi:hypothetical protein